MGETSMGAKCLRAKQPGAKRPRGEMVRDKMTCYPKPVALICKYYSRAHTALVVCAVNKF